MLLQKCLLHRQLIRNSLPHLKVTQIDMQSSFYCQQRQKNSEGIKNLADRLVTSCPQTVQPYMKLMRMDKPTGILSSKFQVK